MAIKPDAYFEPTRVNAGTADYPQGSAKDRSVPGDGTPVVVADVFNDLWGFFQGLLARASITPSGQPDTVTASDYLDALLDSGIIPDTGLELPLQFSDGTNNLLIDESVVSLSNSGTEIAALSISSGDPEFGVTNVSNNNRSKMQSGAVFCENTSTSFATEINPEGLAFSSQPGTGLVSRTQLYVIPSGLYTAFSIQSSGLLNQIKFSVPATNLVLTGIPYNARIIASNLYLTGSTGTRYASIPVNLISSASSGDYDVTDICGAYNQTTLPTTINQMLLYVTYDPTS